MQRTIIFTHTGHSAQLGNFATGDQARVPDVLARHLVEEARCAKYVLEIQNVATPAAVEATGEPLPPTEPEPVEAALAEGAPASAADEPKRRIRTAKE